jgi:peptide chain release factor 1
MGIEQKDRVISDKEFSVRFYSGTGSGGQRRNKVMSCCAVIHIETGLTQNCNGRSRIDNEAEAKRILKERIFQFEKEKSLGALNSTRSAQIGSGQRGDKRRTIRYQDDKINDHITCKVSSCSAWMRGNIEALW